MQNEIIINAELGETRIALLEKGQFAELHIERERDKSVVGNVVKGRVMRVLPGMQAAFVDIGLEKAAFLYVGDYFESTLETGDTEGEPGSRGRRNGRGRGGRSAPPRIDTVLHEGKEIVVQIAKEPIGTKGARITSSISIPGRHLVLTPWSRRVGVSRRIGSDKERRRLREIIERLRPQNLGFIIRTAGDGVREADLQADIRYLATVWAAIQQRHAEQPAPAILYSEHDLPLRIVRDVAGNETKRIITDDKQVHESIHSFVERFVAEPKPNIEYYEDSLPVFERFGLESQINANLERKVWLKSGGSLVIDKSEALTAIDVNTGRFVGKRDLEETVLKTNLEAVGEVVHQLRFRNLGGLIIIDLIDMESAANREKVYRALQDALRADKSRTNILKISELGLVEMTRKRTRENLVQTLCEPCGYCEGRAYVLSAESVAFRALREIRKHVPRLKGRSIAVAVNPHVAEELLTHAKAALAKLHEEIGASIEVRARPGLHQEQFELTVLEPGPPAAIELPWLRDRHPDAPKTEEESNKTGGRRRSRGGRGRSRKNEAPETSEETDEGLSDSASTEKLVATGSSDESSADASAQKIDGARALGPGTLASAAISATSTESESEALAIDEEEDEAKQDATPPAEAADNALLASKAAGDGKAIPSANAGRPRGESDGEGDEGPDGHAEAVPEAAAGEASAGSKAETPQAVDSQKESRIIPRSE
jgi:ribonuclease G